jgi:GT2 family glycosyltransferase
LTSKRNTYNNLSLDLSIIVVSWNVREYLRNCIISINNSSHDLKVEVIVVDNNSSDKTMEMLKKEFPWVITVSNTENVGFARANNIGFRYANGRTVMFLNPDTIVHNNALKILVDFLQSQEEVGMVGPKLVYPNGRIQNTCARKLPTMSSEILVGRFCFQHIPFIGKYYYKKFIKPYDYENSQVVEAISGSAMLMRPDVFYKLNGFRENYIYTGEDIDLCYRVQKDGWLIFYKKEAFITHYSGKSSSQIPIVTAVNQKLSKEMYLSYCFGKSAGIIYRIIVMLFDVPLMVLSGLWKIIIKRETFGDLWRRLDIAIGLIKWQKL